MVNPELLQSWRRTERYLREARAHLSVRAQAESEDVLREFEEYLEHNELALAFDVLESAALETQCDSIEVYEALASAGGNMGLPDRERSLQRKVTELRG